MKPNKADLKNRKTFREKLEQNFDIPSDLLCGGCHVEIRGRGNAVISGCRKILVYTPKEIRFKMSDCEISIKGKRLLCTSYCDSAIVIDGTIESVDFIK